MPSIDKLLPRSLNQDDDERLVKSTEMTDAQNVRVSVDVENDSLVLKNAWGNTLRSGTIQNGSMPSGTNITIGAIGDDASAQIYYFVYNSNSKHSIFRYDQNAKKTYLVYQDSVLQFSADGHVDASIIKLSNSDILLYFNDGRTAPKKINATTCEESITGNGGYPSTFLAGTDQQRLEYITVAKVPPLQPPTVTFVNNSAYPQNDIFEKNFQFAYQYEYYDGEQSVLSPYSRLAISSSQLKDGFINNGQRNFYNQINISVTNSLLDVSKIKVYGRLGDKDAPFFLIDTIDNNSNAGTQVVSFRNDSNYIGLSADVQDNIYDNVPQKADSQASSAGRLFYGGYTTGYDNLVEMSVSALPNYSAKPAIQNLVIQKYTGLTGDEDNVFSVDYSGLTSPERDSKLFLSFTWNDGSVLIQNKMGTNKDYTFVTSSSTFATFENENSTVPISFSGNFGYLLGPAYQALQVGNSLYVGLTGLSGMRFDKNGIPTSDGTGILSGPPTVRFTAQKGTSDTREEDIPIRAIKGGIKLVSGGIQFRETIDIPANTSVSEMRNMIRAAIAKLYPVQYEPQNGNAGFSNLWTGGASPTTTESAAFKGKGTASVTLRATSGDYDYFKVGINQLTCHVDKFVFGTKQAEVEQPYDPSSMFDIVEIGCNVEGYSNRMQVSKKPTLAGLYVTMNLGARQPENRDATVKRINSYVTQGGCFVIENDNMDGYRCFKSGSTHQFGLVYFDNWGRAGGVQPIDQEMFVEHTNNRANQNNLDGPAIATMRIRHAPPSWAARYSVVYAGQGSSINKVQYSIGGAHLAFNDDAAGSFGSAKTIYLSLNTLQSKSNSYDNQNGSLINYGFAAGDRIRVVQYGNNEKATYTWRVSKMVTLLSDPATNPLLDRSSKASIQNTTGDFLVIEDGGYAGWNQQSIMKGTSNWNDKCVIEIYRENKAFDDLFYYEIGENKAVTNGAHVGERTSTSFDIYFSGAQPIGTVVGYSEQRLYKGDIIQDSGGNQIQVGNVMEDISQAVSGFPYKFYGTSLVTWTGTTHSITVTNPDCVLNIDQGDSYFRLRLLYYGATPQYGDVWKNTAALFTQNALVDWIEDPRISDFYNSNFTSLGRRFIYSPDAKRVKRYGSIIYSDRFNTFGTTLGLSSFSIAKLNYKDFSYDYGSIRAMVPYDEIMYIIHERRAGIVPIQRNLITTDAGDQMIASQQVLGPAKYYVGEYGCNDNPESVDSYRGYVFFVDAKAGKVCRLSSQTGIDIISEQLVDSFFKDKMFATSTTAANRRYIGGVDRENTEYIVSSPALSTSTLTIVDNLSGNTVTGTGRTDSSGLVIEVGPVYNDSLTFDWDSDPREFNVNQDQTQNSGKGLIILDQLTNTPIVALSADQSPSLQTSALDIDLPAMTSSFDAFTTAQYSQSEATVTLTASPDSSGTISGTSETLPAFTIAYDIRSTWWSTRYSYIAEEIISLSDRLYTFKDGLIYEHNPDAPKNTFYGTAGDTVIEVVSNFNPSMVKAYEAVSLEGNNSSWSCVIDTTDQTSTIASSIWQNKEGFYYAPIHRDSSNNITYTATANVTSVSGTSELFSLGVVASVSTSVITFKNAINNMSFPLGNTTALFLLNSASNRLEPLNLYASSISGEKALTCSGTVSGVSADDEIVLVANSAIEGDNIRDYYLKARFSNSSTTPHELYAVNFIYSKSNLHNQQGQ